MNEVIEQQPIIISCEEKNNDLLVSCACGLIRCRYLKSELFLLNNEVLPYEELFKQCKAYWDEWEEKYT